MNFLLLTFTVLLMSMSGNLKAEAGDFGHVNGNSAFSLDVVSFKAQRFETVIPQEYDYSCGSAALATLLKFHYQNPVTEQEVLDAMYAVGDKNKIQTQGFSLLDMKQYLESLGYRADGFKINLSRIQSAGIPGIVLINTNGYMHFVVIKGVNQTHVLLGDPALGTRKVSHDEFNKMWNDVFFVIRNQAQHARSSFSRDTEWSDRRSALFNSALNTETLSSFSVNTAVTPNVYY